MDNQVDQILTEIEKNKVELAPIEDDEDELIRVSLSPVQKKEIITRYLQGEEKRDIARHYGVTTNTNTKMIEKDNDIRLEVEKRYLSVAMARENYRLSEAKNKLIAFVENTLQEVNDDPTAVSTLDKMKVLNNVAAVFDKLSITSRLNQEKSTNITEKRTIDVDLDKVISQLPTADDKLAFLRNQRPNAPIVYEGTVDKTE